MQHKDPEQTIAFQGINGANSEMACRIQHPYLQTLPCETFAEIFNSVKSGRAKYGIIPVENSLAGRVAEIHNLLPESGVSIIAEYFHPVEHHLMAVKGTKIEDVKTIYSHPMALMQCRKVIERLNAKTQSYFDTAGAAKDVAQWNDKSKAAIASKLAAELYGLEIIEKNIEDNSRNSTHFLTVALEPLDLKPNAKHPLTSLLFTVRNIPASLYKALGAFATNSINLLKLESYVPNKNNGVAEFFVTIEGRPEDEKVKLAMEELGFYSKKVIHLGTYEADQERYK